MTFVIPLTVKITLRVIICLIVLFCLRAVIAHNMKNIAMLKGHKDGAWSWALSFWLGLPGWIYTIALPDLVERQQSEMILSGLSTVKTILETGNLTSED